MVSSNFPPIVFNTVEPPVKRQKFPYFPASALSVSFLSENGQGKRFQLIYIRRVQIKAAVTNESLCAVPCNSRTYFSRGRVYPSSQCLSNQLLTSKSSLPDPRYFPFKWVDVRVPTLGNFEENKVISEGSTIRVPTDPGPRTFPSCDTPTVSKTYPTDLSKTLQYGQGYGDNQLREFAREHIKVNCCW